MRKSFAMLMVVILAMSFVACGSKKEEAEKSFYAAVIRWEEDSILVTPLPDEDEANSSNLIRLSSGGFDIEYGKSIVQITYNGNIAETYPATIDNVMSIKSCDSEGHDIDRDTYMRAYNDYVILNINPDFPYGEEAQEQFIQDVKKGVPSKFASYFITIEGDPVINYFEYKIDNKIGNYISHGYDSHLDKYSSNPGISYYNFPYLYLDDNGYMCASECKDKDSYNSVINYDSGDVSYVVVYGISDIISTEKLDYKNAMPVLRINEAASATIGIDTVNNPNTIYVNDNGIRGEIDLGDNQGYLARGVMFTSDDSFLVVCDNSSNEGEYLVRKYTLDNGKVAEGDSFFSDTLPW